MEDAMTKHEPQVKPELLEFERAEPKRNAPAGHGRGVE